MFLHFLIYLLAFVVIWLGSGLTISSVERISRSLKASSFAVSFIVLGLFTSVGEMSVGINSIFSRDPEIYIGSLIGATIVLFLLIIPLLSIFGNGIRINPRFQGFNLPASLVVIALPVILTVDGVFSRADAIFAILLYLLLVIFIQAKKGLFDHLASLTSRSTLKLSQYFLRILIGIALIFIASKYVVDQTLYFSQALSVSPFLIGLVFISLGTNIPEFALIFCSAFRRQNQIAFGDYVGSAAFNTFLAGALTLLNGSRVVLSNSYLISLFYLLTGLAAFYFFARSKNTLSRTEGLVMLSLYFSFIAVEVILH